LLFAPWGVVLLISCWSVKGGSGTTVVSVALALVLASSSPDGALLLDLAGDAPAVLGLPDPSGPGVADWLADGDATPEALHRLAVDASPSLRVLPWGGVVTEAASVDGDRLVAALAGGQRPVIADCGSHLTGTGLAVAAAATVSLLVVRPCYLALRRALAAPVCASGVVLVQERDRSLARHDVEDVLGIPVRAEVPWDAAVARAVDAGILATHVPRCLERAVRAAA
jgi:MinD-like ATPase involved in chromosome partitioning or flagellar assembly